MVACHAKRALIHINEKGQQENLGSQMLIAARAKTGTERSRTARPAACSQGGAGCPAVLM